MKLTPFVLINLWVGPELLVEALVKGSILLLAVLGVAVCFRRVTP